MIKNKTKKKNDQPDDDTYRFHDLLDIISSHTVNTNDWKPTLTEKQPVQTFSEVEAPEHLILSSETTIEANQKHIITTENEKI